MISRPGLHGSCKRVEHGSDTRRLLDDDALVHESAQRPPGAILGYARETTDLPAAEGLRCSREHRQDLPVGLREGNGVREGEIHSTPSIAALTPDGVI